MWILKSLCNPTFRNNIRKMYYLIRSLLKKFAVFAIIYTTLMTIPGCFITALSQAVLSLFLVDFVVGIIQYIIPRSFLHDLQDKAIIITGCDSGFGYELARKLDNAGVTVFAGCLFADGEGALKLQQESSDRLKILQLNVTKDSEIEKALTTVTSALGNKRLWAVVNNAGVGFGGEVDWTPVEVFQKTMEVNTFGAVRITKAFLPFLKESKGRIVIVTSFLGRTTFHGQASYCMSKYAGVSLADALRRELYKWSISVHSIEPSLYRTNITNEKNIFLDMAKNWNQTPESVREGYCPGYLDKYQATATKFLYLCQPYSKIYQVVDDMFHAAIGQNPRVCYTPGILSQFLTWSKSFVCDEIVDLISNLITPSHLN